MYLVVIIIWLLYFVMLDACFGRIFTLASEKRGIRTRRENGTLQKCDETYLFLNKSRKGGREIDSSQESSKHGDESVDLYYVNRY